MQGFHKLIALLTFVVLFSTRKSRSETTEVSDTHLDNNSNHKSDATEPPPGDQSSENTINYDQFENGVDLILGKASKPDDLPSTDDDGETSTKSSEAVSLETKEYGDETENRINESSSLNNGITKQEDVAFIESEKDTSKRADDQIVDIPELDDNRNKLEDKDKKESNPSDNSEQGEHLLVTQPSSTSKDITDLPSDDDDDDDDDDQKVLLELEQDESLSEKQGLKQSDYDDIDQVLDNADSIDESRFVIDSETKSNTPRIDTDKSEKKTATFSKKEYFHQTTDLGVKSDDFLENGVFGDGSSNSSLHLKDSVSQWAVEYDSSDTKLWIGIGVGVGGCLTVAAFVASVLLLVKKRRGCGQWNKIADSSFNACVKDDKPIYIKLSQLHGKRQNNGSNYVITVLDESNFSVDSSWSSEEELFGISDILNKSADKPNNKSFCKTSTPMKDKSFRT